MPEPNEAQQEVVEENSSIAPSEEKAPEATATSFGFSAEEQERFQEQLKEDVERDENYLNFADEEEVIDVPEREIDIGR